VCVLCGEFVSGPHWAERRAEDAARGPDAASFDYHRERRRERARRAALAGPVLAHYGLKVRDWDGGAYLLSDGKGRVEVVRDLGALWPAAARLCGRTPDPLDPALAGTLSGGAG
jgi:hypothetical protein